MRRTGMTVVAVALVFVAGCGGDDDDGADGGGESTTTTVLVSLTENGLPFSVGLFSDLCTAGQTFEGAAEYDPSTAGTHPLVILEERSADEGTFSQASGSDYPAGWLVEDDTDFEDNAELAVVELVACASRVEETPNGTECEFDDDGDTITAELVDVTYDVTLYEARTGEEVATERIEASGTECPSFVFLDDGQTQLFNTPEPEQYVEALSQHVET